MEMTKEELEKEGFAYFTSALGKYNKFLRNMAYSLKENAELEVKTYQYCGQIEREKALIERRLIEIDYMLDNFEVEFRKIQKDNNGKGKKIEKYFTKIGLDEETSFIYIAKMLGLKGQYPEGLTLTMIHDDVKLKLNKIANECREELTLCDNKCSNELSKATNITKNKNNQIKNAVTYYQQRKSLFDLFNFIKEGGVIDNKNLVNDMGKNIGLSKEETKVLFEVLSRKDITFANYELADKFDFKSFYQKTLDFDLSPVSYDEMNSSLEADNTNNIIHSSPAEIDMFLEKYNFSKQDLSLKEREYLFQNGNVNIMEDVYKALLENGRNNRTIGENLTCLARIKDSKWIDSYKEISSKYGVSFQDLPLSSLGSPGVFESNASNLEKNGYDISDVLKHASSILFKRDINNLGKKMDLFRTFHISKVFSTSDSKHDKAYSIINIPYKKLLTKFLALQEEGNLDWCQNSSVLTLQRHQWLIALKRYCDHNGKTVYSDQSGCNFKTFLYSNTNRSKELADFDSSTVKRLVPSFLEVSSNVIQTFDNENEVNMLEPMYLGDDDFELPVLNEVEESNYKEAIGVFSKYKKDDYIEGFTQNKDYYKIERGHNLYSVEGVNVSYYRVSLALSLLVSNPDFDVNKALAAAIFVGSVHSKEEMTKVKSSFDEREKGEVHGPVL